MLLGIGGLHQLRASNFFSGWNGLEKLEVEVEW